MTLLGDYLEAVLLSFLFNCSFNGVYLLELLAYLGEEADSNFDVDEFLSSLGRALVK